MPSEVTSRRREPPEIRRAQILEAALQCFAEKGYHAATMDDLVRASGLSKGSLYWHFASKEDVFLALFDGFEEVVFQAWDAVLSGSGSTLGQLRRLAAVTSEIFSSQGPLLAAWLEFFAHPKARARLGQTYARSRERLGVIFRAGIARGELRDLDPEGMAATATAAFEGMLLQALVDPAFDPRRHGDVLVEVLTGGIGR
jgi:AcrR family transcriptional regulator